MLVTPTFQLASAYAEIKDYFHAAHYFIELCTYFESKLKEHPEYLTILIPCMLSAAEALLFSGQKERAPDYITRAMHYLPGISDVAERTRLEEIFSRINDIA